MNNLKVIFIPGNGGSKPTDNWFPWLQDRLNHLNIEVVNVQFPDPILARREYWIPFLEELGADENTILIGHSSGAVAAMRYAETHQILGSVLVAGCYTDLGYETEKESHYYDDPWQWDAIKNNQKWIVQFASQDDPFIPINEARFIHEHLNSEYYEFQDQGHFGQDVNRKDFSEIVEIVKEKLNNTIIDPSKNPL